MDGDGDIDVLVLEGDRFGGHGSIGVWANHGNSTFAERVAISVTDMQWDYTYAVVDLDADGAHELAIRGAGARLFRYNSTASAVSEDAGFRYLWKSADGEPVLGPDPQPVGGDHLFGNFAVENGHCDASRQLFGVAPGATFSACGSYSGDGTYSWDYNPYYSYQSATGYGAITASGYALLPTQAGLGNSAVGAGGWTVFSSLQVMSPGGSIGTVFVPIFFGATVPGSGREAVAAVELSPGPRFAIATTGQLTYLPMAGLHSGISVETGTLNTLNSMPARMFSARLGRRHEEDLVVQANGYALLYYDLSLGAVQMVSAPHVTTPGSYSTTGQPIALPAVINFSASGGVAPYTYRVFSGNTMIGSGSSPVTVSPVAGPYTVMAIDAEGMWTTATGMITVGAPPAVAPLTVTLSGRGPYVADSLGSAPISVTATPSDPQGAVSYSWTVDGGGSIPTGSVASLTASLFIGQHPVQVTVTDAWGRTATATTTVQVILPNVAAAGATGATGPPGPEGPAGPMGPIGPMGPQGPAGAVGPQGIAGPQGERGMDGAMGPVGPQGERGANGAVGPVGPAGETGAAGVPGAKGDTGAAGPVGAVGPVGPAGGPGAAGPTGPAGAQGPAGQAGPAGAKGDKGDPGTAAPSGSYLLLAPGVQPPPGYIKIGTFREERVDVDGRGGNRKFNLTISIWQKQ